MRWSVTHATLLALGFAAAVSGCAGGKMVRKSAPSASTVPIAEGPRVLGRAAERPSFWRVGAARGGSRIVVSLQDQRAYFFKGAELVGESRVSTGRAGFETPTGRFRVIEKDAAHVSNLYGSFVDADGKVVRSSVDVSEDTPPEGASFEGSPMPWFLRFNQGFGFHAGQVPRRRASHGCVRLPRLMARHFFDNSPVGTPVLVQDAAYDPDAKAQGGQSPAVEASGVREAARGFMSLISFKRGVAAPARRGEPADGRAAGAR